MTLQTATCCAATVGILLLLVAYTYECIAERRDAKQHPPRGRLIRVGDHHLHLFCQGSDGPTVVIEQGAGAPSPLWWPIQEQIAAFARVCTYDRAEELHLLLTNADVPGPYLFVAHSYGGLIVREFALRYPTETAGLVLVDTPDETALCEPQTQTLYARMRIFMKVLETASRFGLPRLLQKIPSVRQALWFVRPDEYSAVADDLASLKHLDCSPPTPGQLGDLPLVILTHGQPFPGPFAVLESGWMASQHRLAALSKQATLISAPNSNHMIHLEQPDLVIQAVRRMHSIASRNKIDSCKLTSDQ